MAGVIFVVAIFMAQSTLLIQAQTVLDDQQKTTEDCVQLTDERTNEIKLMIQQLTNFIDELAKQHEYFDLKLVKLNIDKYNTTCDDSTVLELFVNDCGKRSENYDFSGDFIAQTEATDVANVENNSQNANSESVQESSNTVTQNVKRTNYKLQNTGNNQDLNTQLERQTSRIKLNRKQRLSNNSQNTNNKQETISTENSESTNNNNQNKAVQNTETNQYQTVQTSNQNNDQSTNLNDKSQNDDQISSQQSKEVSSTANSVVNDQGAVSQNDKNNTYTNNIQSTITNYQTTEFIGSNKGDNSDVITTNIEQATQNVENTSSNTANNKYASQNIDNVSDKTSTTYNSKKTDVTNVNKVNKITSVNNEQNIETVNQPTNGLNNQITDSHEINLEELQFIRLLRNLIRKEVIRSSTSNDNTDLNLRSYYYTPINNKNVDTINYENNLSDNEYTKPTFTRIDINDDILEFKKEIDKKRCNYYSNRPLLVHLYQNGNQRQVTVI